MSVRPAKTQISLGIRPVWSVFACVLWVAKEPSFLHADSEDWSDWANAQADRSLRWAHTHFAGFVMSRLTYRCYIQNITTLAEQTGSSLDSLGCTSQEAGFLTWGGSMNNQFERFSCTVVFPPSPSISFNGSKPIIKCRSLESRLWTI